MRHFRPNNGMQRESGKAADGLSGGIKGVRYAL